VNAHASPFIGRSESNLIPFEDTIRHATKYYPLAIQSTKDNQCIEKKDLHQRFCSTGRWSYPGPGRPGLLSHGDSLLRSKEKNCLRTCLSVVHTEPTLYLSEDTALRLDLPA
jgi:hypothetical protein